MNKSLTILQIQGSKSCDDSEKEEDVTVEHKKISWNTAE